MGKTYNRKNKSVIVMVWTVISVVFYILWSAISLPLWLPLIISSTSIILAAAHSDIGLRWACYITQALFITMYGMYAYHDIAAAAIFPLAALVIGVTVGAGVRRKRVFSEYMINAVILLIVVMVLALLYGMVKAGVALSMDNALDYIMAPIYTIFEPYGAEITISGVGISVEALVNTVRNMLIGLFCAAAILMVFLSYVLAGLINVRAKISRTKFFAAMKSFGISRIGGILFIIAAISNVFAQAGTYKLLAMNFYAIMQYPFTLCGIIAIFGFMSAYKAKRRTKRVVTAVLVILSLMPMFGVSSGIALVGALESLIGRTNRQKNGGNASK